MPKKAIIIGAGPAGLTAAYELLTRTDIIPVILEKSGDIGGISKTVNYKGNRMDIGGHRFFSKSDRVMQWWLNMMPIEELPQSEVTLTYHNKSKTVKPDRPLPKYRAVENKDLVMLVRQRLSRIYFLRKFFHYPIQLSLDTVRKLGVARTAGILFSYVTARLFPRKKEKSLEDFLINRFGDKLYRLFFKDYTEKVWGISCSKISAEWGAQRIKGISIGKAIAHAAKAILPKGKSSHDDIGQKGTETSLIERFLYPKFGPGQLWEEVARLIEEKGGQILRNQDVKSIITSGDQISAIASIDSRTQQITILEGDYFFSTMPVKELIAGMKDVAPSNVQEVASGLQYRDFITVGVLLKKMPPPGKLAKGQSHHILPDTWIYIQERDVKVGRLQIFNNWSPYMVKDASTVWVGLEYFCNVGDGFWELTDAEIQATAIRELEQMALATVADVLDSTVLRVEKTYPAYFGTYERFDEIKAFTDSFPNLFLIGRNGMHKYNNSDHSMLTAMVSVDNIIAGVTTKANIWSINTEQQYHEEKTESAAARIDPTKIGQPSFKDYLFKDKTNRRFAFVAAIGIILQFCVFKHFYPEIGFINGDSYSYIGAAMQNAQLNTYPLGYSKFLRIFNTLTTSNTALVAFQYLFIQLSALYFLFTLFYFYRPAKGTKIILFAFILFNPIFLYIANYVLSDALFIPLSLTWFTLLIWTLNRPTKTNILLNALVLFLAFTVRYNALYYPLIALFALFLTRQRFRARLGGIMLGLLLIGLFVWQTMNTYAKETGTRIFTPFTGWQTANNAMYAYRFVESKDTAAVPANLRPLDKAVRTYFDTTKDLRKFPWEQLEASTVYMWSPNTPLPWYEENAFKKAPKTNEIKKWASVAPLYTEYGAFLIRHYPYAFLKHYLLPNALKYYAPPVEFLDSYNMGIDSIHPMAQLFFNLPDRKAQTAFHDLKVNILNYYPILAGSITAIFLTSLVGFLILGGAHINREYSILLWLAGALWMINFGFSVYASPIALRFQMFPLLIYTTVGALFLDNIYKIAYNSNYSANPDQICGRIDPFPAVADAS